MNTDRNKYLTEAMGECWHIAKGYTGDSINIPIRINCTKCDCLLADESAPSQFTPNNDFSIWQGFGKLWEWSGEQEWWKQLVLFCEYGVVLKNIEDTHKLFPANQIHPDRFANAVYEFLKGREL